MSAKEETYLQRRIQNLIKARGGYVGKNHGNMITEKGRSDLSFTYKGLSFYWEVKTPKDATNVSEAQGIHCRLARKAGGITTIITSTEMAKEILDLVDKMAYDVTNIAGTIAHVITKRGFDDGTKY